MQYLTHLIVLYLSYTHISQCIWTVFIFNDIQQRHLRALIVLYLSTIKFSRFVIAFISLPIPFQLGQTWLYFIIRCQDDVKPEEKMFWGVLIAHRWRGRHVLSLGLPVLEQRTIYRRDLNQRYLDWNLDQCKQGADLLNPGRYKSQHIWSANDKSSIQICRKQGRLA